MNIILISEGAEIIIEKRKEGMGICISGPFPKNPSPEFQEAYDLLEGLIEYLEGDEDHRVWERALSDVQVPLIALPSDTPLWIITETPYTWKGGHVIVSQDSLQYYKELHHKLLDSVQKEKSELLQIVYLRRAACCKEIIDGLQKALERLPKYQKEL